MAKKPAVRIHTSGLHGFHPKMTFPLEQLTPALAAPRDEISERLYWDAREYGNFESPSQNIQAFEQQLQGFSQSDLLLASLETPVSPVLAERGKLAAAIEQLDPSRRERLSNRLEALDTRARATGLSREQLEATYGQIRRLIENRAATLTDEQRLNIAEQVLSMAADPTSIDQGVHDTCGAAVIEVRSYIRHPEKAAKLVADAALNGEVLTRNGVALPIDTAPHDTSKLDLPKSGQRSHASELFQVAAINLVLNDGIGEKEGKIAFRQNDRRPEAIDMGEIVLDFSVHPPAEKKFTGLFVSDILRMNKLVTGDDEPELVLWKARALGGRQYGKPFTNETEMENALREAKSNGKLPAVIYVYSGNDPLWQDAPNNNDGGRGDGHYINVTDVHPGEPTTVEIDSTWWRRADYLKSTGKSMKLCDLYMSSLTPKEAEAQLRQQIAADVADGRIDTSRQIALARQEWVNGKIDTEGLESSLRELLLYADMRWQAERKVGNLNVDEQRRALTKAMEAVDRLPYANKVRMLETLKNKGVIDDREYVSALVATANEMSEQRMMTTFAGEYDPKMELGYRRAQDELSRRFEALSPEVRRSVEEQLRRGQNSTSTGFFASRAKERRERRKL